MQRTQLYTGLFQSHTYLNVLVTCGKVMHGRDLKGNLTLRTEQKLCVIT